MALALCLLGFQNGLLVIGCLDNYRGLKFLKVKLSRLEGLV